MADPNSLKGEHVKMPQSIRGQALTQFIGEIVVTLEYFDDVIQHAKVDR